MSKNNEKDQILLRQNNNSRLRVYGMCEKPSNDEKNWVKIADFE